MPILTTRAGASSRAYGLTSAVAEGLGGMVLLTPTSIAYTGTSASIGANGSVEFTAVSSLSLNGVFSADYDNYMVAMRFGNVGTPQLRWRTRSSGTDNTTANSYVTQRINAASTTVNAARTTADYSELSDVYATQKCGLTLYFYGPFLTQPTASRSVFVGDGASAHLRDHAGTHNQSTSYDGFTVFPATDSITGLVSVYGLVGA